MKQSRKTILTHIVSQNLLEKQDQVVSGESNFFVFCAMQHVHLGIRHF